LENVEFLLESPKLKPYSDTLRTMIFDEGLKNASKYGNYSVVKLLLSRALVSSKAISRALVAAYSGNHLNIVELLSLDPRFDPLATIGQNKGIIRENVSGKRPMFNARARIN
jgi:hypothetical protein